MADRKGHLKEKTKMKRTVYLYGCGKRCEILLNILKNTSIHVIGIIDSDYGKQGKMIGDYSILSPTVLYDSTNEYVCVTFFSPLDKEPIWDDLKVKFGVKEMRILSFHQMMICAFMEINIIPRDFCCFNYEKSWRYLFDMSWKMTLGGVEAWLTDLKKEFKYLMCDKISWLEYNNDQDEGCDGLFGVDKIKAGINRIIDLMPCTLVFSQVNEMMISAYLLKKRCPDSVKMIMAVHGACDGMYKDILSYRECIDHYVCVSGGIKEDLMKYGIDDDKISVMTIPVCYKERTEREYTFESDSPIRLGFAGRLEIFHKRADLLIALIGELEQRRLNYELSVAGEGAMYSAISDYIDYHLLNNKVKMLGRLDRNEMPDFWHEQDIALNLSDSEGRPLSNLEAMAAGCVPVATCTSGTVEDIEDEANGFVVARGDVGAIADRIVYLNDNRELLAEIGQRAKMYMHSKINMERHLNLWINLFRTI